MHELKPQKNEVAFEYLDNTAEAGEHYYYARIEQSDKQLAWSSPTWVQYQPRWPAPRCVEKRQDLFDAIATGRQDYWGERSRILQLMLKVMF